MTYFLVAVGAVMIWKLLFSKRGRVRIPGIIEGSWS